MPERHWTGSTRGAAGPLSRPPVRRRAAQSSCALLLALFRFARVFYAPFGPASGRPCPLGAPPGRRRPRRTRARYARGKRPPPAARRSFLRPGADGLRPPPRLHSLLPPRPGKPAPGPFRSRARSGSACGRLLASGGSPHSLGGLYRRAPLPCAGLIRACGAH